MKRKIGIIVLGLIAMFLLALDAIIWIKYDPSYSIASISFGVVIGVVGLLVLYSSILLCKKELKN
jgi:uncharacterized membrane protein YqjE